MPKRTYFSILSSIILALFVIASLACSDGESEETSVPLEDIALPEGVETTIELTSEEFPGGEEMPGVYTCYGLDRSPPVSWNDVPEDTRSLALIVDEPNSPDGPHKVNWVIYNLPPDVTELPRYRPTIEETGSAATQGRNHTGRRGWTGPCPEKGGKNEGFYVFNIYALDTVLGIEIEGGARRNDLIRAMDGHVIGHGQLTSRFCRSDGVSASDSPSTGSSGGRGSCPPRNETSSD